MDAKDESPRYPPQIKFIVGNEACERFSYYGMRSILTLFMVRHLLMAEHDAEATFHFFVASGYFLTILGGWLSDRYWGKYKTIFAISIVYCLGQATLALWHTKAGLFCALALIAFGMGGIKSAVSAFMGDQFTEKNKSLVDKAFSLFYWAINVGSCTAMWIVPPLLDKFGPHWAFGVPGILMAVAILIFWLGRDRYLQVPPTRHTGEAGFMAIFFHALRNRHHRGEGRRFFDAAIGKYTPEQVNAVRAAASVLKVFLACSMFWALYDQQGSSWVLQGDRMRLEFLGLHLSPAQMQAINPILILILIPVFSLYVYPAVERLGIKLTALRKIGAGMFLASFSFVSLGIIELLLGRGLRPSIAWQFFPYFIISVAEILVSIPGLEFAYSQAPRSMKSTLMSFWFLTIFAGNLLTAVVAKVNVFHGAGFFFFFAGLMILVSGVFAWIASQYQLREYFEKES